MSKLFELVTGDIFQLFPIEYRSKQDPAMRELADAINRYRDELFKSGVNDNGDLAIEDLANIYRPERCPPKYLDLLAKSLDIVYDNTLTDREKRIRVFGGMRNNKKHGTVDYLIDRIEEVTGVRPDVLFRSDVPIGWDQLGRSGGDGEIMEPGYPVSFYGGILWDQNNEFFEVFAPSQFLWQVYRTSLLIDIKQDGVFDANPAVNDAILEKVYFTVGRYKEATMAVTVGYIDTLSATDIILKTVYSTKFWISPGDPTPPEHVPRFDPGIV